jgi:hypothetical protein
MRPGLDYRAVFETFATRLLKRQIDDEMEKKNVERGQEDETRARLLAAAMKKFALTKPQMQRLLGEMGLTIGDIEMAQLIKYATLS